MNTAHAFSICILCTALAGLILSGCDESGSASPFDDAPAESGLWMPAECPTELASDRTAAAVNNTGPLTPDIVIPSATFVAASDDLSSVIEGWGGMIRIGGETFPASQGVADYAGLPDLATGECVGVVYDVIAESGDVAGTGRLIVLRR